MIEIGVVFEGPYFRCFPCMRVFFISDRLYLQFGYVVIRDVAKFKVNFAVCNGLGHPHTQIETANLTLTFPVCAYLPHFITARLNRLLEQFHSYESKPKSQSKTPYTGAPVVAYEGFDCECDFNSHEWSCFYSSSTRTSQSQIHGQKRRM